MGIFTRKQKGNAASAGQRSEPAYTRRRTASGRDEAARELRRRARRRLLGAIAMVLVAVIVLPMVLDSEPAPLPDDIAIRIPSQSSSFQPTLTAVAPVAGDGAESAASGSASTPIDTGARQPATGVTQPGTVDPRVPASIANVTPVEGASGPAPSATQGSPSTTPGSAPQNQTQPSPTPEARASAPRSPQPNTAARQKEAEAARALALLQGKPVPPPPTPSASQSASRYAVQVVAVRSRDGADSLLSKLRGAGLTAYIETIKTPDGQVHRVRLGPFNSRAQAESAQAQLKSIPGGYNGNLVPL